MKDGLLGKPSVKMQWSVKLSQNRSYPSWELTGSLDFPLCFAANPGKQLPVPNMLGLGIPRVEAESPGHGRGIASTRLQATVVAYELSESACELSESAHEPQFPRQATYGIRTFALAAFLRRERFLTLKLEEATQGQGSAGWPVAIEGQLRPRRTLRGPLCP